MFECLNCGNPPDTCVCVPWCWRHDRARPCEACKVDPEPETDASQFLFTVSAVVTLVLLIVVGLIRR